MREATSEPYGPRVYFSYHIAFRSTFFAIFVFRSTNPKTQKYIAAYLLFLFVFLRDLSLLSITT